MTLVLIYVLSAGAVYALVTQLPRLLGGSRRSDSWSVGPGISEAVFDPGGWLTVCTANARILVYEIESRKQIGTLGGIAAGPQGFNVTAMTLGFRGGRRYVATAGGFGEITVRQITTGDRPAAARAIRADGAISALSFSPTGDDLLIGGEDGRVWKWRWELDPDSERQPVELRHIYGFAARRDGSQFAAIGDGAVALWSTGSDKRPIIDRPGARCAAFNPGGRLLAIGGGPSVTIVDVNSGLPRLTLDHPAVTAVEFSPTGGILATVAEDGVRLWATESGSLLTRESQCPGTVAIQFASARTLRTIGRNGTVRQVYIPDISLPASARQAGSDGDDPFAAAATSTLRLSDDPAKQPRARGSQTPRPSRPLIAQPRVLAASLAIGAIPVAIMMLKPADSAVTSKPSVARTVEWVAPPKQLRFDRPKMVFRPPAAKKNAPSKSMTVYFIPPEEQRVTQKPPLNPSPIDSATQQIKGAVAVQQVNPAEANRKWTTGAAILERWRPAMETYPGSIRQSDSAPAGNETDVRKEIKERTANVRLLEAQAYQRVSDQLRQVADLAKRDPNRPIGEVLRDLGLDGLHLEQMSPTQLTSGGKKMEQEAVDLVKSVLKESPDARVTGATSKPTPARDYIKKNLPKLYKKAGGDKKPNDKKQPKKRGKRV